MEWPTLGQADGANSPVAAGKEFSMYDATRLGVNIFGLVVAGMMLGRVVWGSMPDSEGWLNGRQGYAVGAIFLIVIMSSRLFSGSSK